MTCQLCTCIHVYLYVNCADNEATLFRASTLATMLMDQLMKLTASNYLHSILEGPIQQIADLQDSCEVRIYMYMYMYMYIGFHCMGQ